MPRLATPAMRRFR